LGRSVSDYGQASKEADTRCLRRGKPEPEGHDEILHLQATYKDKAGEWRWYLRAVNGKRLADSGEGYKNKKDCLDAIDLVKGSKDAKVEDC
jgi:uncharacterized protein YegP (UPF0339 family)